MKRSIVRQGLLSFLLLSGSVSSFAIEPISQESAGKWLEAMAESFRSRNYDGVLVSNRGGKMRSVRVVHLVQDGMESERLEYLDGDPVEVQRDAHPIDCIHADKQLFSESSHSELFGNYSNQAGAAQTGIYQLGVLADSRVAGRAAVVIAVKPNDDHRYTHRLFLDKRSQLLLKAQVLDQQEKVLESFQFTQISVDDEVEPDELTAKSDIAVRERFHSLPMSAGADAMSWQLGWLPPGFVAASQRASANESAAEGTGPSGIQSVHYTDGFALFSVFLQSRDNEVEAFETRTGSTLAYVAPKKLQGGWASVTVVGELPLATAVKIAQSLKESPGGIKW